MSRKKNRAGGLDPDKQNRNRQGKAQLRQHHHEVVRGQGLRMGGGGRADSNEQPHKV